MVDFSKELWVYNVLVILQSYTLRLFSEENVTSPGIREVQSLEELSKSFFDCLSESVRRGAILSGCNRPNL